MPSAGWAPQRSQAAPRVWVPQAVVTAVGFATALLLVLPSLTLAQGTAPPPAASPVPPATVTAPVATASPAPAAAPPAKQRSQRPARPQDRVGKKSGSRTPSRPRTNVATPVPAVAPPAADIPRAMPVADEPLVSQPQRSTNSVGLLIAEPASVSMSSDLRKRLPTDTLVADIRTALSEHEPIATEVQRPSVPGYVPPGDEAFSFAEGGNQDAIIDRITAGYPGLNAPLVLITVAEQGPYVIAAARVFSPAASGGKLKRVARYLVGSADANPTIAKTDWPVCFAKALRQFMDNADDGAEATCEKLTLKGSGADPGQTVVSPQPAAPTAPAAAPPAPVQAVPVPAAPVQSPPPPPSAAPSKVEGLLDKVPTEGVVSVTIPPGASKSSKQAELTSKNGVPQPTVITPGAAPPPMVITPGGGSQPTVVTSPVPVENKPSPTTAMLPQTDGIYSHYQLLEQLLTYGFVYRPHEQTVITNKTLRMADRDDVGQCLSRGTMTKDEVAWLLREDLLKDRSNLEKRALRDPGYFEVTPHVATDSSTATLVSCGISPTPLDRFSYYLARRQGKFSAAEAQKEADEYKTMDRTPPRREWRLPTVIEAYAVATAIIQDERNVQMTYWTSIKGGQQGMLSIKKDANVLEVDHLVESAIPPKKATAVILVHN